MIGVERTPFNKFEGNWKIKQKTCEKVSLLKTSES